MSFEERLPILWGEPNEHVTEAPADSSKVAEVEKTLGIKLPQDYLRLIQIQNGGYFSWFNHCEGADWDASELWGLSAVANRDWEELKLFMQEQGIRKPREIDQLYPFAGNGHAYICFDYRGVEAGSEPSIAFIDVESFDVDLTIAPRFRDYIEKLEHTSPDIEYAIVAEDERADAVKAAVGRIFSVKFEEFSDSAAETFRACYPSIENWKKDLPFEWMWLRRCKTKSGFHSCFQVPDATWLLRIGCGEVPEILIAAFEAAPDFRSTLLYRPA